jgi:hypothetical protein
LIVAIGAIVHERSEIAWDLAVKGAGGVRVCGEGGGWPVAEGVMRGGWDVAAIAVMRHMADGAGSRVGVEVVVIVAVVFHVTILRERRSA